MRTTLMWKSRPHMSEEKERVRVNCLSLSFNIYKSIYSSSDSVIESIIVSHFMIRAPLVEIKAAHA